ncbi:hypothetical protein EDD18DRAFT_221638 [Armillaria luteobubalina]|uniref:Uncharacterized protein n=1 Tax=Armillaria luteobubalina TaxID=153913 RepID=A0AA39Q4E5_9AGAR|nr:hypothetical protein EDD18DRAFT_221638 [Armillaria luteobubalina]
MLAPMVVMEASVHSSSTGRPIQLTSTGTVLSMSTSMIRVTTTTTTIVGSDTLNLPPEMYPWFLPCPRMALVEALQILLNEVCPKGLSISCPSFSYNETSGTSTETAKTVDSEEDMAMKHTPWAWRVAMRRRCIDKRNDDISNPWQGQGQQRTRVRAAFG